MYKGRLVVDLTGTKETVEQHPDAYYILKDIARSQYSITELRKVLNYTGKIDCKAIRAYLHYRGWLKIPCLPFDSYAAAEIERKAFYGKKLNTEDGIICPFNLDYLL